MGQGSWGRLQSVRRISSTALEPRCNVAPAMRTCDENLQGGSSWETAFRVRTLQLLGSLCHSVHVWASTDTHLYTHTHSMRQFAASWSLRGRFGEAFGCQRLHRTGTRPRRVGHRIAQNNFQYFWAHTCVLRGLYCLSKPSPSATSSREW